MKSPTSKTPPTARTLPPPAPLPLAPLPLASLLTAIEAGETAFRFSPQDRDYVMGQIRRLARLPTGERLLRKLMAVAVCVEFVVDREGVNQTVHGQLPGWATITLTGASGLSYEDERGKKVSVSDEIVFGHELLHAFHRACSPELFDQLYAMPVAGFNNAEELMTLAGQDEVAASRIYRYFHGSIPMATIRAYGEICENSLLADAGSWFRQDMVSERMTAALPPRERLWGNALDGIAAPAPRSP